MTDGVLTLRDVFRDWTRMPGHVIFQSWTRDPAGRALVPPNLPQSTPYTHTYLIDRGLRCLRAVGPCASWPRVQGPVRASRVLMASSRTGPATCRMRLPGSHFRSWIAQLDAA